MRRHVCYKEHVTDWVSPPASFLNATEHGIKGSFWTIPTSIGVQCANEVYHGRPIWKVFVPLEIATLGRVIFIGNTSELDASVSIAVHKTHSVIDYLGDSLLCLGDVRWHSPSSINQENHVYNVGILSNSSEGFNTFRVSFDVHDFILERACCVCLEVAKALTVGLNRNPKLRVRLRLVGNGVVAIAVCVIESVSVIVLSFYLHYSVRDWDSPVLDLASGDGHLNDFVHIVPACSLHCGLVESCLHVWSQYLGHLLPLVLAEFPEVCLFAGIGWTDWEPESYCLGLLNEQWISLAISDIKVDGVERLKVYLLSGRINTLVGVRHRSQLLSISAVKKSGRDLNFPWVRFTILIYDRVGSYLNSGINICESLIATYGGVELIELLRQNREGHDKAIVGKDLHVNYEWSELMMIHSHFVVLPRSHPEQYVAIVRASASPFALND